jgi:hypothetical protein
MSNLARMMEMKLDQGIGFAVHDDAAAGLDVDANGVAGVDDFERRKFVIKAEWVEIRGTGVLDVDGRLQLAGLAGGELRVEFAPVVRAVGSGIAPARRASGGGRLCECGAGAEKGQNADCREI